MPKSSHGPKSFTTYQTIKDKEKREEERGKGGNPRKEKYQRHFKAQPLGNKMRYSLLGYRWGNQHYKLLKSERGEQDGKKCIGNALKDERQTNPHMRLFFGGGGNFLLTQVIGRIRGISPLDILKGNSIYYWHRILRALVTHIQPD